MESSPVVNTMVPVVIDRLSAALENGRVSAAADPLQRVIDVTDRVLGSTVPFRVGISYHVRSSV